MRAALLRASIRRVLGFTLLAALAAAPLDVSAQRARSHRTQRRERTAVLVGDAGARVGGEVARTEMDQAMREALSAHPTATLTTTASAARYVVTGSVVELNDHVEGADHLVNCRVSIVVADRTGNVRAMLEGRAGARGDVRDTTLQRSAVRGAVRSAMRGLSDVAR
jgi:hypothetical protein